MSDPYEPPAEIKALLGKQVAVDTDSSYVYIGTLKSAGSDYLALSNVDVHDTTDTESTKEFYIHEVRKLGIKKNRQISYVRLARVISVAPLDEVIVF